MHAREPHKTWTSRNQNSTTRQFVLETSKILPWICTSSGYSSWRLLRFCMNL
jgi:hypothetical protein